MSTVIASRNLTTHPHPHQPARQRPSRADLTPIDSAELARWSHANEVARKAYHGDTPAGRNWIARALR